MVSSSSFFRISLFKRSELIEADVKSLIKWVSPKRDCCFPSSSNHLELGSSILSVMVIDNTLLISEIFSDILFKSPFGISRVMFFHAGIYCKL